jgi:hypothetical protein
MKKEKKEPPEKKKKELNLEITELFLVKSEWDRTFFAEIVRDKTEDGKTINRGTVVVNEGKIWSAGETQDELGDYLDDICTMKLDFGLHANGGVSSKIGEEKYFHN